MHRLPLYLLTIVMTWPAASLAQDSSSTDSRLPAPIARPANDSIFRRARRLVGEGNGPAGRALVDSLLKSEVEGTPAYGNALYWRGALAETAVDAERDYRRVIVEYPLAFYADDALLAIAELEQARGDRAGALLHLQRFVREHPVSPARGVAALGAARLAFEQRDTKVGCAMVNEARASLTAGDVEIRNQLAAYDGRCPITAAATPRASVAARAAPIVPAPMAPTPVAPSVPADSSLVTPPSAPRAKSVARRVTSRPPASVDRDSVTPPAVRDTPPPVVRNTPPPVTNEAARGRYTVQLAAYNTKAEADRLVAKLAGRGLHARVSGTAKPFRVRTGFFRTQGEAASEVTSLKGRGIIGFVTTEAPATGGTPTP